MRLAEEKSVGILGGGLHVSGGTETERDMERAEDGEQARYRRQAEVARFTTVVNSKTLTVTEFRRSTRRGCSRVGIHIFMYYQHCLPDVSYDWCL